jgi:hypothetical protein
MDEIHIQKIINGGRTREKRTKNRGTREQGVLGNRGTRNKGFLGTGEQEREILNSELRIVNSE